MIDILSSVKSASRWAYGTKLISGTFGNSLVLALILSAVMILIVMFMYPAKKDACASVLFKMFVYMFLITSVIIFLHDGVLLSGAEEDDKAVAGGAFMGGITMAGRENDPAYGGAYIPIKPTSAPTPTSEPASMPAPEPASPSLNDAPRGGITIENPFK
jgi:hypothetical protein